MKRITFFLVSLGLCAAVHAAPPVAEAPINGFGTPVTVSISTDTGAAAAWTKIPTSQTSGRLGVFLDVPNTNTGRIVGHFGNCTSTSIATSVRPIEIAPSSNSSYFPIREDVCLWLVTLHTAAESVHYQEVKQ